MYSSVNGAPLPRARLKERCQLLSNSLLQRLIRAYNRRRRTTDLLDVLVKRKTGEGPLQLTLVADRDVPNRLAFADWNSIVRLLSFQFCCQGFQCRDCNTFIFLASMIKRCGGLPELTDAGAEGCGFPTLPGFLQMGSSDLPKAFALEFRGVGG